MPSRLKRFHHSGQTHFITFCRHRRRKLFLSGAQRPSLRTGALEPRPAQFSSSLSRLCGHARSMLPASCFRARPALETLAVAIRRSNGECRAVLIGEASTALLAEAILRLQHPGTTAGCAEKLRYVHCVTRSAKDCSFIPRILEMEQLSSLRHGRRGMCLK